MMGCVPETQTPAEPTGATEPSVPDEINQGEQVRQPQDVSEILADTLAQLAVKVPEPTFGTLVGEWTVLCLARSDYFTKPRKGDYFTYIKSEIDLSGKLVVEIFLGTALSSVSGISFLVQKVHEVLLSECEPDIAELCKYDNSMLCHREIAFCARI